MPETDLQQLLAIAQGSRDPYQVAAAAVRLMAIDGQATVAAGHYLRALNSLQLGGAAHRFLQTPSLTGATGVIPWSAREERFLANVAALKQRHPAGTDLVTQSLAELPYYELHVSVDGNHHILDLRMPVPTGWPAGLLNHRATMDLWQFDRAQTPLPPPVAFDGIGFIWLLARVLESTQFSYGTYSCAVHILESDPLALAMLFHMFDMREIIAMPRIKWFIQTSPDSVLAEFRDELLRHPEWSLPGRFVRCAIRPRPLVEPQPMLVEVQKLRENERKEQLAAAQNYYAGKDAAYWASRFETAGPEEPLRVMGITSRYSPALHQAMREFAAAVESAGGRAEVLVEPDDHAIENPFPQRIVDFKPDLIVTFTRMRHESPLLPKNVPFLIWDLEGLSIARLQTATALLNDLTFMAGAGGLHGFIHWGWPEKNTIMCQLPASTTRWKPRDLTPGETDTFTCDFSYVSAASETPEHVRDTLRTRFTQQALELYNALCEKVLAQPEDEKHNPWHELTLQTAAQALVAERGWTLAPEASREVQSAAQTVGDRAFRHQTLQWVSDYCRETGRTLKLYGRGWDAHPKLAPHAALAALTPQQLHAIFLATRINLQLMTTGVLHTHLLDGICAGGFFMYRQTIHETGDRRYVRTIETISQHVFNARVRTFAELDALKDQSLKKAWTIVSDVYRKHAATMGEAVAVRSLASAHKLRHPLLQIPSLADIAFDTAPRFAKRATAFLEEDTARRILATDLRQSIEEQFSHHTRWREFFTHMRAALKDV